MRKAILLLMFVLGTVAPAAAEGDAAAQIARGRYLTHDVAMCVQCHSPRSEIGVIDEGRVFHGGPVEVTRPTWQPIWAPFAPDLVALAALDPGRILNVLRTGQRPDGSQPRPPMPPFRLSDEDAAAVVHYLRSLK